MAILPNAGILSFLSSAKKTLGGYAEHFLSGFAGYGWKIWNHKTLKDKDGKEYRKYKLEIDNITVRETMTVFELLIQKIRAVKGALGITQASGKIKTVAQSEDGLNYLVTIEDEMSFMPHDFVRCQAWKDGGLKGYWVEISDIVKNEQGEDTLVIPVSEFSGTLGYGGDGGMETVIPNGSASSFFSDGSMNDPLSVETTGGSSSGGIRGATPSAADPIETLQAGDPMETLQAGDPMVTPQAGDPMETPQAGDLMETLQAGDPMETPQAGDELIQFGNAVDENRQSAIYLHADEGGQPAIDILFDIRAKSFDGCVKTRVGGNIPGTPGMKGFYCENGMIKATDESGGLTYCLYPDGTANLGAGSAMFRPDRSGHIAGGAIKWQWDGTKRKFVTTLSDVLLTWDNLSDEVKENLKGEGAVVYSLRLSQNVIACDEAGYPKDPSLTVQLYRKQGNQSAELATGTYLRLAVGFVNDKYDLVYNSDSGSMTVKLSNGGVALRFPLRSVTVYAFETEAGGSDITAVAIPLVKDGAPGEQGEQGDPAVLFSIETSADLIVLDSDQCMSKVRDISVLLYKITSSTKTLCADFFASLSVFSASGELLRRYPSSLLGGFGNCEAFVNMLPDEQRRVASRLEVTYSPERDGVPAYRKTLNIVHDMDLPWLQDWNDNKTQIGDEMVVSPKMFSGVRDTDGLLTGVALGKALVVRDGQGNERTLSGLFGLSKGKPTFMIDSNTGNAEFTGVVHATGGEFRGKVIADEGTFTGVVNATDGKFNGSLSLKYNPIQEEMRSYLTFDTGFNFSGCTYQRIKNLEEGKTFYLEHELILPVGEEYVGVQCCIENTASTADRFTGADGDEYMARRIKIKPSDSKPFICNPQSRRQREIKYIELQAASKVRLSATIYDGELRWFVENAEDLCYQEHTQCLNTFTGKVPVKVSFCGEYCVDQGGFLTASKMGDDNCLSWERLGVGCIKFTFQYRKSGIYFPIIMCIHHGYGWISEKTAGYFVAQTADDNSNNDFNFYLAILEF